MADTNTASVVQLVVIRHGDTDWAEAHRHTGSTNVSLNARGEAHALLLAPRLAGMAFARVFASPLLRVRQTCALAGFDARAEVSADLTEWNMGQDEGRTTDEIRRERPSWDMFRDGTKGGENLADVFARADRFVSLAQANTGVVAAFASRQIIRCIAARWLGLPPISSKCFGVEPCSVGILSFEHHGQSPLVSLWNDVGHLQPTRATAFRPGTTA
jgi:probable phosphoglycerate mutase